MAMTEDDNAPFKKAAVCCWKNSIWFASMIPGTGSKTTVTVPLTGVLASVDDGVGAVVPATGMVVAGTGMADGTPVAGIGVIVGTILGTALGPVVITGEGVVEVLDGVCVGAAVVPTGA